MVMTGKLSACAQLTGISTLFHDTDQLDQEQIKIRGAQETD